MLNQYYFSHIYVERDALNHPLTQYVLEARKKATVIAITHYKDLFSRSGQDFDAQKRSPKLILAVRRGPFLFPGAAVCDHFGHERFFYASQMMNCPYNCEYCFLRGMFPSGHMVAFVNTEDYLPHVLAVLPAYVSISYDTDLLAMEPLFHFAERWIHFAAQNPTLTLELRTKSANFLSIAHIKPVRNVILSWTVSPDAAVKYELGAPALLSRIHAMQSAITHGWKVRLCCDPVLLVDGWEEQWRGLLALLRKTIDIDRLYDTSVGGFRVSKTYFNRMRKLKPDSIIFSLPLENHNGVMCYNPDDEERIRTLMSFT